MPKNRRKFSSDFRMEAVRLLREREEAGVSLASVSRELGIGSQLLRKWDRKLEARGSGLAGGAGRRGKLTSQEEEIRRLRREVETLRQEAEFAKKAAVFFAKESR
jgi:transposase